MTHGAAYNVISVIAIAVLGFLLFMALFQPSLKYRITAHTSESLNSPDFFRTLEALTDSKLEPHTEVEVLPNGENFYVAELDAIKNAQKNVNLEAYIFKHGEIASKLIDALTERARAGVKVHVLLDGVGSGIATTNNDFKELRQAGGKMFFYHPLRWYNLSRYNNRTHREILVVDGKPGSSGAPASLIIGGRTQTRRIRVGATTCSASPVMQSSACRGPSSKTGCRGRKKC